jgi:hypothetical protein
MENEVYKDLKELNEIELQIQDLKDEVLDLYNTCDKSKCESLLKEMTEAENDIRDLEKLYQKFLETNEVY